MNQRRVGSVPTQSGSCSPRAGRHGGSYPEERIACHRRALLVGYQTDTAVQGTQQLSSELEEWRGREAKRPGGQGEGEQTAQSG